MRASPAGSALLAADLLGDCIELFLCREDAERFLADVEADDSEAAEPLSVEAVEFEAGLCRN